MGDRIKQIRLAAGLTQQQFAERIGLSRNFIAVIETSDRKPSDRTLSDICREFNVSLAWLQDGVGEMYVQRSANEELALLVTDIMSDADDSFRKRFISLLMALPPEDWGKIERFISDLQNGSSPQNEKSAGND